MPEVLSRVEEGDSMERLKTDPYWLNMGTRAVEALSDSLLPDLTTRRREILAEYLGGIMDMAYNSGIRLGQLTARLEEHDLAGAIRAIK